MRQRRKLLELHSALAHLDDPPYLESHPLSNRLTFVAQAPELSRGQALRRALRLAIAALDPGGGTGPNGIEARSYQVLYRWAVSRQSMVAIAELLGISQRQAYRELRRATEALAQVLDDTRLKPDQTVDHGRVGLAHSAPQVREELERLSQTTDQDVDISYLLADVVESAECLARSNGVGIQLQVDEPCLYVAANRVMLRQAILNLLSHAVGACPGASITVCLYRAAPNAVLRLSYHPQDRDSSIEPTSPYAVAAQLLDSLGISWTQGAAEDGTLHVVIRIPLVQEHTVLIIDDNEGVIALLRRYLRRRACRVHGASDAGEGLQMLEHLRPDVVILDIMMPDRDGWEVLRALRAREAGGRTRVIICSIINDPKLATALGADAFLNKPVDCASLLRALDQVLAST